MVALMRNKLVLFFSAFLVTFIAAQSGVGQWAQVSGLNGGPANCFALMGTNLFAGTGYSVGLGPGGVYRSTDLGTNWTVVGYGSIEPYITALAVSGTKLFAGTGNGVFLSTDSGETWMMVDNGLFGNTSITALVVIGTNVFAGTKSGGIYLTTNNGKIWKSVSAGIEGSTIYKLVVIDTNIIAATSQGLFQTSDSGTEWRLADNGLQNLPDNSYRDMTVSGGNVYFSTWEGVYRSTDLGANWTSVTQDLPKGFIYAIGATGTTLFADCYSGPWSGILRSTDSGATWDSISTSTIKGYGSFSTIGSNIIFQSDGLYLSTDDGIHWNEVNTGELVTMPIQTIASQGGSLFAGSQTNGGFQSTNDGISWTDIPGLQDTDIRMFATVGSNLFALGSRGVHISSDNGATWQYPGSSLSAYGAGIATVGSDIFLAGYDSVYRSVDNGLTWTASANGFPQHAYIMSLGANGPFLFAALNPGGVYLSTDNGLNWMVQTNGLPSNAYFNSFATVGVTLFVATDKGIYLTTDNGANWSPSKSGLPVVNANSFAVYGPNIFAATSDGVFFSADTGANWKSVNDGLGQNNYIRSLAIHDGYLVAGATGVWRRPLKEMIAVSGVPRWAGSSVNIECYPNPFSSTATIQFTSTESGIAQVRIVNMLGQEVARLFDGEMSSSNTSITWNAHNVVPGVYWCEVWVGGQMVERSALVKVR